MLRGAARQRQPQELAAQVLRIVGTAVLTAAGLVPEGNTGGANVSAFRRLPVPPFDSTEVTPHGFRATACTLLNELGWRSEAIERQMAHGVSDSIRRHYNHAQHLPERRVMMQAWADYLDGLLHVWLDWRGGCGQLPSYARPFPFPESGQREQQECHEATSASLSPHLLSSGTATDARDVDDGDSPFEEMRL